MSAQASRNFRMRPLSTTECIRSPCSSRCFHSISQTGHSSLTSRAFLCGLCGIRMLSVATMLPYRTGGTLRRAYLGAYLRCKVQQRVIVDTGIVRVHKHSMKVFEQAISAGRIIGLEAKQPSDYPDGIRIYQRLHFVAGETPYRTRNVVTNAGQRNQVFLAFGYPPVEAVHDFL
ncbi:hypothetical protein BH24ACT21_BH24ACT21_18280 [soil metagenome]